MRKFVIGLVMALGLTGLGAVGPVQAHNPVPDRATLQVGVARSITPAVGRYRGHDQHDRLITFTYRRAKGIQHFRINHHLVGRFAVAAGAWSRTCAHGFCAWGAWVTKKHVTGYWIHDPDARFGRRSQSQFDSVLCPKLNRVARAGCADA